MPHAVHCSQKEEENSRENLNLKKGKKTQLKKQTMSASSHELMNSVAQELKGELTRSID